MTKKVAIVGRPNVGKSTLFNRLTRTRKAITSNVSGTTRDRHYGMCTCDNKEFIIIDTGGYNGKTNDNIEKEINTQIELAINEASTILFLVDCHDGLTYTDKLFTEKLRQLNKKVILVANKSDNINYKINGCKFVALGLGEPTYICANNGKGTEELLNILTKDIMVKKRGDNNKQEKKSTFNENEEDNSQDDNNHFYKTEVKDNSTLDKIEEDNDKENDNISNKIEEYNNSSSDETEYRDIQDTLSTHIPRIAIIGKPNVGKSSLINTLSGEKKMIVDAKAGTTRDAVDSLYNRYGYNFILVDTAGLRRKSRKKDDIEFYSSLRSLRELEDCDVCLYVIDATIGICAQDISLLNLAIEKGKGIVVLINKIDVIKNKQEHITEFKNKIKTEMKSFPFIPIVYISATQKKNIFKAIEKAKEVFENRTRRIQTSKLNNIILPIIKTHPPISRSGQEIKIKYITQLPTQNIVIAFFCNNARNIKAEYKRFLEARIREHFNLEGVPIKLVFKNKENDFNTE